MRSTADIGHALVRIIRTVTRPPALPDGGAKLPRPQVLAVQRAREAIMAIEAALLPLIAASQ
jgi:hypothetical protein